VPYFKRVNVERGTQLWANGSEPDACVHLSLALALFLVDVLTLLLPRCRFYVIESGMLRATYVFANSAHTMTESMVAGTVAGEMSFLSRTPRNTNVVAERDSTLWKMEVGAHEELGRKEGWQFARRFEEVVLKIATAETEVLMVRPFLSLLSRLVDEGRRADCASGEPRRVTSCRACEEDGPGRSCISLSLD